jgi:Protein of unknown function (DUF4231)
MECTMSDTHGSEQSAISEYIANRVDDQLGYFDSNAIRNQKAYKRLKSTSIACNVLTTMAIALAFTVSEQYKVYMGILALVLSTIVLATYQWEEFQNYGAKWEKFRLVAEYLKSEKFLFLTRAGQYADLDEQAASCRFVEAVEHMIHGTDVSYFSLIVEPGRRVEKRLQQP